MRSEHDAMLLVRADLCERLEALHGLSKRFSSRDFSESVAAMKLMAGAYGLTPVVRLAEALERAVYESGDRGVRNGSAGLYLHRLRDAIGCERVDETASQAMVASVAVRLGA